MHLIQCIRFGSWKVRRVKQGLKGKIDEIWIACVNEFNAMTSYYVFVSIKSFQDVVNDKYIVLSNVGGHKRQFQKGCNEHLKCQV